MLQGGINGKYCCVRASQYQLAKDLHYELQQITMNGNNKTTDGGKKRTLTMRTVILEQWITQAAKGDHRARQQLIAYGDKHGSDLFAGQHKAIREAAAAAAAGSSAYVLSEEVLDRLSPSTLDEIRGGMGEI